MDKADDATFVRGNNQTPFIKEGLREGKQFQYVTRKAFCGRSPEGARMPQLKQTRRIGIVELAILDHRKLSEVGKQNVLQKRESAAEEIRQSARIAARLDVPANLTDRVCSDKRPDFPIARDSQHTEMNSSMLWTDREISAWLDELLSTDRMTAFEAQLRLDESLRARVAQVIRSRDQGGNTIGEIWQRNQLSCPSRTELGGFLLQTLSIDAAGYVEFHLQTVGCRVCQANLRDLEEQASQSDNLPQRRRRFYESSAGLLRRNDD